MVQREMAKENPNPRIVVVGGGIAGLSAAVHLITSGLKNVTVLEATDIIGGRMNTKEFGGDGRIVELGANWIHGSAMTNSVFRLASQHKLLNPYVLLNRLQGYVYTSDGEVISPDLASKVYELFMQWEYEEGSTGENDTQSPTVDTEKYLRGKLQEALPKFNERDHEAIECVFNALINYEQFHRGDNLCTSPSVDTGYIEIPDNVKVPKGMVSILNALYKQLPPNAVRLQQVVRGINTAQNEVAVLCESGEIYLADHVICTCSLGFLKANHKTMFQPQLPDTKQKAIENIGFGRVNKVFLKYTEPFWHEGKGGVYLGWRNRELSNRSTNWIKNIYGFEEVLNNPAVLVAWISGQGAEDVEKLSDEVVKQTCTKVLRQFLGDPSIPLPQDILRSQWVSNPYTCGSYSYWTFNTKKDSYQNLSVPVYNSFNSPQLCFAGEATNPLYYSTMHGARSSGLREAERLLKYYKLNKNVVSRL